MMEENANAYSEVIEILKLVDDEKKLEALPMDMLEVLKSKANPEYKPEISKEIPIDEQDLLPETYSILSWIAMKYWSDEINEIDKEKIENIEEKSEEDEEVSIENNIDEVNENDNEEINQETDETYISNLPIVREDLKWYQRIKAKIIEFFNKIFKKDK